MSATTATLTSQQTVRCVRSGKATWAMGAVAALLASAGTVAVAAGARALDVPLRVGGEPIPLLGFAQLTFVASLIGTVLAVVMSRRASRPRHTFVTTTLLLTMFSIIPDAIADAQTATRVVLALTHVAAAAIVIPALASRLAD
jgi:Family of unknown function (DUF6069)